MAKESNRKIKDTQCGANSNGNDRRKGLKRKACEIITRKEVAANIIGVNLVRAGRRLRKLLLEIDKLGGLYSGRWLFAAVYRYKIFWVPLLVEDKLSNKNIMPPIDVYWAWLLHMSDPKQYHEDCKDIAGKVIPHQLCTLESLEEKQSAAEALWRNKYPEEPWYLNRKSSFFKVYDKIKSFNKDSDGLNQLSEYNFKDAACCMQRLIYQISGTHFSYKPFLIKAALKYRRFLALQQKYPKAALVPSPEVHWMWLAHAVSISFNQANSDKCMPTYSKDMMHMFDEPFALSGITHGRPESSNYQTLVGKTNALWMKNYGQPYYCRGATYRGDHPKSYLKRFENLIPNSATDTINFELKVIEVLLSGNFQKGPYLLKLKQEDLIFLSSQKLVKLKVNHTGQHNFAHDFFDQNLTFTIPKTSCENWVSLSAYPKNTYSKIKKFFGQRKFCSISEFRELRTMKNGENIIKKVFEDSIHGSKVEIEFEVHNRFLMSWYQQESCRQAVPSRVLSSHEMASFCGVIAHNKMLQHMPIVAPKNCIHRILENGTQLSSSVFNIEVSRQAKNNLTCVTLYAKSPEQEPLPVVLIHNLDHAATPTRSQLNLSRLSSLDASLVNTEAGEQAFIVKTYSGDLATVIGHWQKSKGAKEGELIVRIVIGSDAEAYCVVVPYEKLKQSPLIGTHHTVHQKNITICGKAHDFLKNVALGLAITTLHTILKPVSIQMELGEKLNDAYSFSTKLDFSDKPNDGIVNFLAGLGALCLTAPDSDNFRKKTVKSFLDCKQLHCYVPILATPVQNDTSDSSSDESDEDHKTSLKSKEKAKKVPTRGSAGRLSARSIRKKYSVIGKKDFSSFPGASYPSLGRSANSTVPSAPPAIEFDFNDDFGWNVSESAYAGRNKGEEKVSIHDIPTMEITDTVSTRSSLQSIPSSVKLIKNADMGLRKPQSSPLNKQVDFKNIKHIIPKCRQDNEENDLPVKNHSDNDDYRAAIHLSKNEKQHVEKQKKNASKIEEPSKASISVEKTEIKNVGGVNAADPNNDEADPVKDENCEPNHLTKRERKHLEKPKNASKIDEDVKTGVEDDWKPPNWHKLSKKQQKRLEKDHMNKVKENRNTHDNEMNTENANCEDDCSDSYGFESQRKLTKNEMRPEKQCRERENVLDSAKNNCEDDDVEQVQEATSDVEVREDVEEEPDSTKDGKVHQDVENNEQADPNEEEDCEPAYLSKRGKKLCEKQREVCKTPDDPKTEEQNDEKDWRPSNWNTLSKKVQKRLEKEHTNQQNMKTTSDNTDDNDDAAGKMFLKTTDGNNGCNQQQKKSGKKGKRK